MNDVTLPEDCSKQWELLLLLLSSEEKKIDRTSENEVEVMSYFYKNEGVRKILMQWLNQMHSSYAKVKTISDIATKSDEISLHWRQKGNECFRNNSIMESYKCYTKSVLYADPGGMMYSLGLANRSASLLKLKKFEDCLVDIELALKNRYPNEQRHKLFLRQADCLIELKQSTRAKEALDEARQHSIMLSLPAIHANEFDRHLKLVEQKLEILNNLNEELTDVKIPEFLGGENPNFVSASTALDLRQSDRAGRYVVTNTATLRGDVLFVEDPYAFVALPFFDDMAIVCENCCRGNCIFLPCLTCSRAVYCSETCREKAWNVHHKWECVGAQSKLYPTIGIAHLALRVLLVTAASGFPVAAPKPNKSVDAGTLFKIYSKCNNIHIYNKDTPPFFRMFNLVTNFEKMNNVDYIQYALTATMLTLYLESFTTFFNHLPSRLPFCMSDSQIRLFAAAMILRSLGQLVCNGHAALTLMAIENDDDRNGAESRTLTEREIRHATAIYPSAAMMNHSCDPNIINTFYRNKLIIRCGRDIPAGGEVLNCYGPHKAREPASDRRAQLRSQYLFNCNCSACSDSERRDGVLVFSAYVCQVCKGPVYWGAKRARCMQCRRIETQPERITAQVQRADELELQAERATTLEERCDKLQASYKLRQQVYHRHNSSLRLAADKLARVYVEMGEYSKCVELLKQNIQSLEYQFGSFSVEVAHELRKLSDAMLERMFSSPQHPDYRDWCLETHKIIKKAHQLLELNYGSWEPLVERLKRQESALASLLADSRSQDEANCVHHNLHYNLKI